MRWMAALLALTTLSCKEEESACAEVEAICALCDDAEALTTCQTLLRRRDQVDCSLAMEDLAAMCGGGEAGPPDDTEDAAPSSGDSSVDSGG